MIFVPPKEVCALWNEMEDLIFIILDYDKNTKIMFKWHKNDNGKYDPFSLEVDSLQIAANEYQTMYLQMLTCQEPACQALPQLRYNDIMKKWYCCCPSSMICTKNEDEDELKLFQDMNMQINEENGFFDRPRDAIVHWNQDRAKYIIGLCEEIKKAK